MEPTLPQAAGLESIGFEAKHHSAILAIVSSWSVSLADANERCRSTGCSPKAKLTKGEAILPLRAQRALRETSP
jgi:hypothetical protein